MADIIDDIDIQTSAERRITEMQLEIQRLQQELAVSLAILNPRVNQKKAAQTILRNFINTPLRYCLLRANEQVGKTGTYHYLIRLMFNMKLIDNAYIVCGANEIELLNQCRQDHEEWHKAQPYKDNIHIVFRQDFSKVRMNIKRCLIINDESHLVQNKDQSLQRFYNSHGLTAPTTLPMMVRNNTYIVSVDATPYAEEATMVWGPNTNKFKVTLEDGENYFGVKEYYESGLIKSTFELSCPRGRHNFISLLEDCPKKYALVRIQGKSRQKKWLLRWAEEAGCDILHFTSQYEKGNAQITVTAKEADTHFAKYGRRIPSLEVEPTKTTIVLIDGRLRCGKRVPKQHIGFVWEFTQLGTTDVIRQSLLGRMCGYLGDSLYEVPVNTIQRPLIFVPERVLAKPEKNKVILLSDLERSIYPSSDKTVIGPRFFNSSIPGRVQNKAIRGSVEMTPCVPIRFQLNAGQTAALTAASETEVKMYCLNTLIDRTEGLITNNYNLTDAQKEEIIEGLDTRTAESCHLRRYKDDSNQAQYKSHIEAYMDQTASSEHISDFHFITFCVVYPGFIKPAGVEKITVPGEVYAIFYTRATGYIRNINKASRIARVADTSRFTLEPSAELSEIQAGAVYGFSPKILDNSDNLFLEFNHFIDCAKKELGVFSRRFTSLHNGEYIVLPRNIYGRNLERLAEIFSALERRHSIKISYAVKKRRIVGSATNDIELKFISWA